ncbi:hypothetical protein [Coprobacter fastidiosus]|uniref:hypothetical protein n=1 Tax=Coprobacter fastidiosus TaxID=1099853 RepID=UPI0022E3D8AF|nr:hypothetical protein [Coprobacter fastidiosus]
MMVMLDIFHSDKKTKTVHGITHTHETYTNKDPGGEKHTGVSRNDTHIPTFEEVERIKNNTAIKSK